MSDLWFSVLVCTCDESVRRYNYGRVGNHSATCQLACGAVPPWSTFGKTSCRLAHGHRARGPGWMRHDNGSGTMWIDHEDECGEIEIRSNARCNRERGHVGNHFDGKSKRWDQDGSRRAFTLVL